VPKYLFKSRLNALGLEGTLNDGGTGRRVAVTEALAALGGSLECFYYGFGSTDAYAIVELPGNVEAAAAAVAVGMSGAGSVETVVLIDPEEMDSVAQIATSYRPPGG